MEQARDFTMIYITIAALVMASLGTTTGWFIYNKVNSSPVTSSTALTEEGTTEHVDESMFAEEPDAQGVLKEAADSSEGTHRLERDEGEDVYLLSTVMDLDSFIGKKVKIWGNTVSSQDVEWLMDVGRIKLVK